MSNDASRSFARHNALAAAARWRLPFSRQSWRGPAGSWMGAGAGSSLDFQDHRNYVPGDDPRHIHWQAYARTGALTMKLYRAEVAPLVDIVVDVSASMSFTPDKSARTAELLAFCVESADRAGAPVRVRAAAGREVRDVTLQDVRDDRWRKRLAMVDSRIPAASARKANDSGENRSAVPPAPREWRPGAMKVLISDLLFPGDPSTAIGPLAAAAGIGILFVPVSPEEQELPWRGNVDLVDCETNAMRRQRIDEGLASRYRAAYARHFSLWREACRKRGLLFARVPCGVNLALALGGEPFSSGMVEASR